MREILLSMNKISKSFPGVQALKDVDFHLAKGEIHALMGENGAGKSTLIKILTGIYQKDSGEILLNGKQIAPSSSNEAQSLGISTIYQEINLVPNLSICENIFLGRQQKKNGRIDWHQIENKAKELLNSIGIDIDVTEMVSSLSTPMQQMVAIVRAMSLNAQIMVVDEATSSLDENEVKIFFNILRRLKEKGISVIFISHRLAEIYEICDHVTILKDGENVGDSPVSEISRLELVSKMIGKDASGINTDKKKTTSDFSQRPAVVEVHDIRTRTKLRGVSFQIHEGEVVGLAGLLGSGRTELARIIFGADHDYTGEIVLDKKTVRFKQPKDAIQAGIAYCSESRMLEGILPNMSVKDNLTAAMHPEVAERDCIVRTIDAFANMADFASTMGVRLVYENHAMPGAWGKYDFSYAPRLFLEICKELREIDIGINFDMGNPVAYGYSSEELLEKVIDMVETVHISDMKVAGSFEPCAIGKGAVPIRDLIQMLDEYGFEGWYSIEEASGNSVEGIEEALKYIRSITE